MRSRASTHATYYSPFFFTLQLLTQTFSMKLTDIKVLNEKETRGGFGEGIHEIGKENENVVVLTADLAGSLKLGPFIKDFPNRLYNAVLPKPI